MLRSAKLATNYEGHPQQVDKSWGSYNTRVVRNARGRYAISGIRINESSAVISVRGWTAKDARTVSDAMPNQKFCDICRLAKRVSLDGSTALG